MFIKQFYTNCLSEAAYYIESEGEAAIIDPLRDIEVYVDLARERNARIKYIFETHFHADFVSGHLDLGKKTGAPVIYGPGAETTYQKVTARDAEVFPLGKISLVALHTPGHTIESTCYLLRDEHNKDHAIFTGDTLFVGDVGRPDLSSGNMDSEELAGILYDSLQKKIMPLNDEVIVYPAHGPGSSCGKNLGPDTSSTIGKEKQTNYALLQPDRESFIKAITSGLPAAPGYFAINAKINQTGYDSIEEIIKQGTQPLGIAAFKNALTENTIVLDTRSATTFTNGFIPGSIFIGLDGRFAEWAGSLLPFNKELLLITDEGKEQEAVIRLSRVGFDKMKGFLKGGFEAWQNAGEPIDMIIDVEADELIMDIPFDEKLEVLDVRKEIEFAEGHLKDATNIPLDRFTDPAEIARIDEESNLYVHCAGGYRSVIAASLLKRQGIDNIRNVLGGWNKIKEQEKAEIVKEASVLN
jgi:glyoxylase-like metal-dependent hydrolase (beta-lactamase superfamily II)/rhodanese-related sulfurtransferase